MKLTHYQNNTLPPLEHDQNATLNGRSVDVEYIEEGNNGDYNETDPDDIPLLRINISELKDGEWEVVRNGSFCTEIDARITEEAAKKLASDIVTFLADFPVGKPIGSVELLSWLETAEDLGEKIVKTAVGLEQSEYKPLLVKVFRTPAGAPTCSNDQSKTCIFLKTEEGKDSYQECTLCPNEAIKNKNGFLVPAESCPFWTRE